MLDQGTKARPFAIAVLTILIRALAMVVKAVGLLDDFNLSICTEPIVAG